MSQQETFSAIRRSQLSVNTNKTFFLYLIFSSTTKKVNLIVPSLTLVDRMSNPGYTSTIFNSCELQEIKGIQSKCFV